MGKPPSRRPPGELRLGPSGRGRMMVFAASSFLAFSFPFPSHTGSRLSPLWCGSRETIPRIEVASFALRPAEGKGGEGQRESKQRARQIETTGAVCRAETPRPRKAVNYRTPRAARLSGLYRSRVHSLLTFATSAYVTKWRRLFVSFSSWFSLLSVRREWPPRLVGFRWGT